MYFQKFFWAGRRAKKSVFFGLLAFGGGRHSAGKYLLPAGPMTPFLNVGRRVRSEQSWFFSDVQPEIYPTTRSPPHAGRRMSREHSPIFEHVGYHLFLFGFGAVL